MWPSFAIVEWTVRAIELFMPCRGRCTSCANWARMRCCLRMWGWWQIERFMKWNDQSVWQTHRVIAWCNGLNSGQRDMFPQQQIMSCSWIPTPHSGCDLPPFVIQMAIPSPRLEIGYFGTLHKVMQGSFGKGLLSWLYELLPFPFPSAPVERTHCQEPKGKQL